MIYKGKELSSQEVVALLDKAEQTIAASEPKTPTAAPENPQEGGTVQMSEENKKLAEDAKQLADDNKKLAERIVSLEQKDRQNAVELRLNEYKTKGIPPAILEIARKVMLSDVSGAKSYKLSEKQGDKDVEIEVSLSDSVLKLLDAIQGVKFAEETVPVNPGNSDIVSNDESKAISQILSYANENKLSFTDAYRKLLSEKKVPEIQYVR